jgi:hypothetical protein
MDDTMMDQDAGGEAETATLPNDDAFSGVSATGKANIEAAFQRTFGGASDAQTAEDEDQASELEQSAAGQDDDAAEPTGQEPAADATKKAPAAQPPAAKPTADATAATATDGLDPALKQAALLNGWDAADIDAYFKANPEAAVRTFEREYSALNAQTAELAALGQSRIQGNVAAPVATTAARGPQSQQPAGLDALLTDESLAEFAANNGEDIVEKFLKPFKAELDELRATKAYVQQLQKEALATQVDAVFGKWEADHADFYGKGASHTLAKEHYDNRSRLAMLNDQIQAGAALKGITIPLAVSMERAHNILTADRRQQMERQRIMAAVKGRSNQIVARPTQRRTPTAGESGGPSDAKAMASYAAKARELGIDMLV